MIFIWIYMEYLHKGKYRGIVIKLQQRKEASYHDYSKHTFAYTLTLLRVREVDFCKKRKNRKKKTYELDWAK